jgi:hypothetical protein
MLFLLKKRSTVKYKDSLLQFLGVHFFYSENVSILKLKMYFPG